MERIDSFVETDGNNLDHIMTSDKKNSGINIIEFDDQGDSQINQTSQIDTHEALK